MDLIPAVSSVIHRGQRAQALSGPSEETLVADERADLTPSQLVERKLVLLLKANPVPLSQVKTGPRPRPHR